MNFETNIVNYDTSEENLRKVFQNFFKDYKEEIKNRKITQRIPVKLALLMDDKQLKQLVTSRKVTWIITTSNTKEAVELQNRINKL